MKAPVLAALVTQKRLKVGPEQNAQSAHNSAANTDQS